jgi:hypothetical protein
VQLATTVTQHHLSCQGTQPSTIWRTQAQDEHQLAQLATAAMQHQLSCQDTQPNTIARPSMRRIKHSCTPPAPRLPPEPASVGEGHAVQRLNLAAPAPVLSHLLAAVAVRHAANKHLTGRAQQHQQQQQRQLSQGGPERSELHHDAAATARHGCMQASCRSTTMGTLRPLPQRQRATHTF